MSTTIHQNTEIDTLIFSDPQPPRDTLIFSDPQPPRDTLIFSDPQPPVDTLIVSDPQPPVDTLIVSDARLPIDTIIVGDAKHPIATAPVQRIDRPVVSQNTINMVQNTLVNQQEQINNLTHTNSKLQNTLTKLRNDLNKCCVDKNYPRGDILDSGYPVVNGDTELLEDKIGKLEKQLDSIQTKIDIDDLKITEDDLKKIDDNHSARLEDDFKKCKNDEAETLDYDSYKPKTLPKKQFEDALNLYYKPLYDSKLPNKQESKIQIRPDGVRKRMLLERQRENINYRTPTEEELSQHSIYKEENLPKKCREYEKGYTCTLHFAEAGERDIYVIFSEYDFDKDDNIIIGIGTPNSEERLIVDVEVVEDLRTIEILRLVLDRELDYNHPENTVIRKVLSAYNPDHDLADYNPDNQLSHNPNKALHYNDFITKLSSDEENDYDNNNKTTAKIKNNTIEAFNSSSVNNAYINETLIYIIIIVLLFILRIKVVQ